MDLYLIAHKVRGEPAFDIATVEEVEGEEHWIIPTSGHRAYPYWEQPLTDLWVVNDMLEGICNVIDRVPSMPDDLPDHYTVSLAPSRLDTKALLQSIGLLKPVPTQPIRRR